MNTRDKLAHTRHEYKICSFLQQHFKSVDNLGMCKNSVFLFGITESEGRRAAALRHEQLVSDVVQAETREIM